MMKEKLKGFLQSNIPPLYTLAQQLQVFKRGELRLRGLDAYLNTRDRQILEESIIPYFVARDDLYKILFVGCDWYTKPYNKLFEHKEYWTIEPDPFKARFGSQKHVIDVLENLEKHFSENYFDLIIANGVFGFGINTKEDAETAFQQCFRSLQQDGIFLLGWDNVSRAKPFPLQEIRSLNQFAPYVFPPLSTSEYYTETRLRHVFSFFIKAAKPDMQSSES
jgi:SAM-dependent methyltransferase